MRLAQGVFGLLVPVLCAVSGCAYTLQGDLPKHLRRVRVPVFRNATMETGLERELTREVIQAFGADGRLQVAGGNADLVVSGRLLEYRQDVLREDALDDVIEARVVLVAEISVRDVTNGRELLTRQRVTNLKLDPYSGVYRRWQRETEGIARDQAVADLARNIVRTVTEYWPVPQGLQTQ
jgi:hypothetical protein